MTNQEILANGPEGWTHYVLHNGTNYYFKIDSLSTAIWTNKWEAYSDNRLSLPDLDNVRNRKDIERIVYLESVLKGGSGVSKLLEELSKNPLQVALVERDELRQQLAKANERVEELELMLDGLADYLSDKNKFAIEQQIEGVAFFALCLRETGQFGLNDCNFIYEYAQECKEQLRKEQE